MRNIYILIALGLVVWCPSRSFGQYIDVFVTISAPDVVASNAPYAMGAAGSYNYWGYGGYTWGYYSSFSVYGPNGLSYWEENGSGYYYSGNEVVQGPAEVSYDAYFYVEFLEGYNYVSGSNSAQHWVKVPLQPDLQVNYRFSDGTGLPQDASGKFIAKIGDPVFIHINASSSDNDVVEVYWRLGKPQGYTGLSPSQWAWQNNVNWGGETATGGNWSATLEPITMNELGTWDFWYHAKHRLTNYDLGQPGWTHLGDASSDIVVENVRPTNGLSAPATTQVGQLINLVYNARRPADPAWRGHDWAEYKIAYDIYEKRSNAAGDVLQDWTPISSSELTFLDKADIQITRPAATSTGSIEYQFRSWNQFMAPSENLGTLTIQVVNSTPTITISPAEAKTIEYGQTTPYTSTAADVDGNLSKHIWKFRNREGTWTEEVANVSGGSSTRSITFDPRTATTGAVIGSWKVQFSAEDSQSAAAGSAVYELTVNKATPIGTYNNKVLLEGVPTTAAHFDATFQNPHNPGVPVPGPPTHVTLVDYVIIANGTPTFPNGTYLHSGQLMPAGNYRVLASIPASTHYNAASVAADFIVTANPNADNDGDGLSNAIETLLGTDPNSPADPAGGSLLNFKIHTPRP